MVKPVPRAALTHWAKTGTKYSEKPTQSPVRQHRGSSLSAGINRLNFVYWHTHFWLEEINSSERLLLMPTKTEVFNVLECFSSPQFYSERGFFLFGMVVFFQWAGFFASTRQDLALNNTPLIHILHQ